MTPRWIEKGVASSFFPERAKVNFERLIERIVEVDETLLSHLDKRNIPWIASLFSGSQALTDLAMKDPRHLFWALQKSVLHSTRFKREMMAEMEKGFKKNREEPKDALCLFKNKELLRIGWRDLLKFADTVETIEDLSRLADVTIRGALRLAEEEVTGKFGSPLHEDGSPGRFIVVGLGKLGGRELNFSSDIDILYIYDSDEGETEGGIGANHMPRKKISVTEYFGRLAQRLTSILSDNGPFGILYRVDLNLRPEGNRGPIANSLPTAELYYESWGQPWERQMLVKSRVCAGDESLGDEFMKKIKPFVFRRNLDFSHLKEIQQSKLKIDKHLKSGKDKYKNNVKLGKGGIREIEFIIQSYQLIYGGKMPWLAETNSLKALHRIFERGLIGNVQYAQLADALLFLRDLENRMQVTYGRQIQIIPDKKDELLSLALKMNLKGKEELLQEYQDISDNVHDIFSEFFHEDEEKVEEQGEYYIDLDNEEEAVSDLGRFGFDNPRRILNLLLHIRDGEPFNHPSSKSRKLFSLVLPELMALVVAMPDMEKTVINLDLFFSTLNEREGVYEVLLKLPSAREALVSLFSLAQTLSETMINQPGSAEILSAGNQIAPRQSLNSMPETIESYDKELDWLRRERNAESIRIGISYIVSHKDPFELMKQLTRLADEFVQACFSVVENEMHKRENGSAVRKEGLKLAVLGLGKLGRREMNFGSDLDLIFISADEFGSNGENHTAFCQKLLNTIGAFSMYGSAYKFDARLRPEGEKGGIVITEGAALDYYRKRGALWERLALSGARVVAGDFELGNRFIGELKEFVYGPGLSSGDISGIDAMKIKMEKEKIKISKGIPVKYGKGGIVDVEFFAQRLKLEHGLSMPEIHTQGTIELLRTAIDKKLAGSDIEKVIEGYRVLRTIETHIRMETGIGTEYLPDQPELQRLLEEKIGKFIDLNGGIAEKVMRVMEEIKKSLNL
jgi:glutamate-ammonia-ligase adenylyltransferase